MTASPKPWFSRVLMLMTAPGLAVVIVVRDDRSRVPAAAEGQSQLWLEAVGWWGLSTAAQCWHVPQDKGQEEGSMGNLC